MKKLSVFALVAALVAPAFAEDVPAQSEAVSDKVATVESVVQLSAEERAQRRQALKDEIKAELKQEYTDAKKEIEQQAKDSDKSFLHGLQIGVGLSGTSGLNGIVGYANKDAASFWGKRFGVRFDFATTRPVKSLISDTLNKVVDDGIDIGDVLTIADVDIEASHYAALVDFYLFGDTWLLGGWRITGGYAFGEMNMTANIAGALDGNEFELAGQKYAYSDTAMHGTADLDWKYRGPYLGTGFDIGLFDGFDIYLDAGVVFTNRAAELSLTVPVENLQVLAGGTWVDVDAGELETTVAKATSDAQKELDDFKFYPMVKMGFLYRF